MILFIGNAGKESTCNAGDLGSIPGLERSSGEGKGYPLQYSGLENSTDYTLHGVTESDKTEQLSLSSFHFHKECTLLKRNYSGKQNNHSDLTIDDFPGHSLFLFFLIISFIKLIIVTPLYKNWFENYETRSEAKRGNGHNNNETMSCDSFLTPPYLLGLGRETSPDSRISCDC